MKTASFIRNAPPSGLKESVDTDVTPMMNVFIILLPFLVSMAVLTRLSIIEFSVPPNVSASLDMAGGKPALKLTVVVAEKFLAVTYGEKLLDSISMRGSGGELDELSSRLAFHRAGTENKDDVVVAAGDRIKCERIVAVMDRCTGAGFTNVGLASAAEMKQ